MAVYGWFHCWVQYNGEIVFIYACPSKFNTARSLFIFLHWFLYIRASHLTTQQKVVNVLVMVLYALFAVVFYMLTQRRGTSGESSERLYWELSLKIWILNIYVVKILINKTPIIGVSTSHKVEFYRAHKKYSNSNYLQGV